MPGSVGGRSRKDSAPFALSKPRSSGAIDISLGLGRTPINGTQKAYLTPSDDVLRLSRVPAIVVAHLRVRVDPGAPPKASVRRTRVTHCHDGKRAKMMENSSPRRGKAKTTYEPTLDLYSRGLAYAEIAARVGISQSTVNGHVRRGRRDSDPRVAQSRRGAGTVRVNLNTEYRGSLLHFATVCLQESGALAKDDLNAQRRAQHEAGNVGRGRTAEEISRLGPVPSEVIAVQRAVHLARNFPPGDALPYPMELAEELGVLTESPTRVPAIWFEDLASEPPATTTAVYALGEALFTVVEHVPSRERLERQIGDSQEVDRTIRALYSIATQSPRKGARAVHLLGRLGVLALDPQGRHYDFMRDVLYDSPLGWRAMRVASRLLFEPRAARLISTDSTVAVLHDNVEERVTSLLHELHRSPPRELYPERSFIIETLFKLPTRTESSRRQVCKWLLSRAKGEVRCADGLPRPFRERAYAAVVLASRFPEHLEPVIHSFNDEVAEGHEEYSYALEFLRRTPSETPVGVPVHDPVMLDFPGLPTGKVRQLIDSAIKAHILQPRTTAEHGWKNEAIRVPHQVSGAVTKLMQCALGDLHGTRRRRAMDTLRHAGLGPFVAQASLAIAEDDLAPTWLKSQAVFVSSFAHHARSIGRLVSLSGTALQTPSLEPLAVSALHAIGDIGLHMDHASDSVGPLCAAIEKALQDRRFEKETKPMFRAAAYALATVRAEGYKRIPLVEITLKELMDASSSHDEMTSQVAAWGLARHNRRTRPPQHRIPDLFVRQD